MKKSETTAKRKRDEQVNDEEPRRSDAAEENKKSHLLYEYKTPTVHKDSLTPDWFKILGVRERSNPADIKRAYHALCRIYHPDKNTDGDEEDIKETTARFNDVKEAYRILSDRTSRVRYTTMVQQELEIRRLLDDPEGVKSGSINVKTPIRHEPDERIVYFPTAMPPMQRYDVSSDQVRAGVVSDTVTMEYKRTCSVCEGSGCDVACGMKVKTCPDCGGKGRIEKKYFGVGKDVRDRIIVARCAKCVSVGKIRDVTPCSGCLGTRFEKPIEKSVDITTNVKNWPKVTKVIPSDECFMPFYVRFRYPFERRDLRE